MSTIITTETITSTDNSTTNENEILCSLCLRATKEEEEKGYIITNTEIMSNNNTNNEQRSIDLTEKKSITNNNNISILPYSNDNDIITKDAEFDDNSSCATPPLTDEESSLSSTSSFRQSNNTKILLPSLKKNTNKTILLNNYDNTTHHANTIKTRNNSNNYITKKTERRVRGLWNVNIIHSSSKEGDMFEKIHNIILIDIFNYLSTHEKICAQDVCERWKYCLTQPNCWKDVVINQDDDLLLDCITSKALHIERLTISNNLTSSDLITLGVGSCTNLRSLKVKSYDELYDNHINLMLLIKKHLLTNVCIEYCPRITDLSLGYISKHIDKLCSLSLKGCTNITDDGLVYLSSKLEEVSSICYMFPSFLSTSSLQNKKALHSLDLSFTNITADGICNKLLSSTNTKYKIQKLIVGGSCGTSWNNNLFSMLQNKLSWNVLQELDISTTTTNKEHPQAQQNNTSYLTDEAFYNMQTNTSLTYINVSGHVHITGLSISSIIKSNPNLHVLDISNCTSIIQHLDTFSNVLHRAKNLHTLLLKNCFANECNDEHHSSVLYFIQSICESTYFRFLVKEINFEGCYVIDKQMVQMLRKCCNNTVNLKLEGTKYYEEEVD